MVWTGTASCLRPSSPAPTTAPAHPPQPDSAMNDDDARRPLASPRATDAASRRSDREPADRRGVVGSAHTRPSLQQQPKRPACGVRRCLRSGIRRTTTEPRRGQGQPRALPPARTRRRAQPARPTTAPHPRPGACCRGSTSNPFISGPSDGNADGNGAACRQTHLHDDANSTVIRRRPLREDYGGSYRRSHTRTGAFPSFLRPYRSQPRPPEPSTPKLHQHR